MSIELQTNIALESTPNDPKHLVNVKWVEDYFTGKVKMPVRAVSTANLAATYGAANMLLTMSAVGALVIDGVTLALNDRVLLAGQTDATQNGIYFVTELGDVSTAAVLTRAKDFNASDKIFSGLSVAVNEGTLFADTVWKLITDGVIVLDTTALSFIQWQSATGAGKYAATITGDSLATDFTVTHGLGTTDVSVTLKNMVTNAMTIAAWSVVDSNNVKVSFDNAPTPAQVYRVVVIG